MSRLRNLSRSLISGYAVLVGNILFTAVSYPLARNYLTKDEFGLWALVVQISGYLMLVEMGMSGAVTRILVDYKDDRGGQAYGGVIRTAFGVFLVQGLLAAAAGIVLSLGAGQFLELPAALIPSCRWLLAVLSALLVVNFVSRVPNLVLQAHQRTDVANWIAFGALLAQLVLLWFFFRRGAGVFSFLWSSALAQVLTTGAGAVCCSRLGLWPQRGRWGRASRVRFWELFHFSRNMFFYQVGMQFVSASQVILVTRILGLEAAAVWMISTKAFSLITQVVYRFFDYACPAIAEMIVRGERECLRRRFRSLLVLSASLAVLAGCGYAFGNTVFVKLWMGKDYAWNAGNDVLLGGLLVLSVLVRIHTGLVGLSKQFAALPYLVIAEGVMFCALSLVSLRLAGITGMLLTSLLCMMAMTLSYGLWRSSRYFQVSFATVAFDWLSPSLRLLAFLAPLTLLLWLVSRGLPEPWRLGLGAALLAPVGTWAFVRFGLDDWSRAQVAARVPIGLRRRIIPVSVNAPPEEGL